MKKPVTRKERIKWIESKLGHDYSLSFIYNTDKEVKKSFDILYLAYKDKEDYKNELQKVYCLRCKQEIEVIHVCACGENRAILSEEDYLIDKELNTNLFGKR